MGCAPSACTTHTKHRTITDEHGAYATQPTTTSTAANKHAAGATARAWRRTNHVTPCSELCDGSQSVHRRFPAASGWSCRCWWGCRANGLFSQTNEICRKSERCSVWKMCSRDWRVFEHYMAHIRSTNIAYMMLCWPHRLV